MFASEVFRALRNNTSERVFEEVLWPWVEWDAREYWDALAEYSYFDPEHVGGAFPRSLHWPYALSRVSDVLLLGFQADIVGYPGVPWAHQLFLVDYVWPTVSEEEYLAVFTAFGMERIEPAAFDPFLHEIVAVEQSPDPAAPIEITGRVWPGLTLGEMLFSREGVTVWAGREHAQAGFADSFPLYSTFLRRYRATCDLSLGWGSNSQWATDFRRDYRTAEADHLNVDGRYVFPYGMEGEDPTEPEIEEPTYLTLSEQVELMRNRCLLRSPESPQVDARDPRYSMNLSAFDSRLTIPRATP